MVYFIQISVILIHTRNYVFKHLRKERGLRSSGKRDLPTGKKKWEDAHSFVRSMTSREQTSGWRI